MDSSMRRAETELLPETYTVGDVTLRNSDFSITLSGKTSGKTLPPTTYRVGLYLLLNINKVCTRDTLLECVWGITTPIDTRRVDTHLSGLRHALAVLGSRITITAIQYQGYLACFPESEHSAATRYVDRPVRRSMPTSDSADTFVIGDVTLDSRNCSLAVSGRVASLQSITYQVGLCLLLNMGLLCTRKTILESVWGITTPIDSRRVDTHVVRIRHALASLGSGCTITSIRSAGYIAEFANDQGGAA